MTEKSNLIFINEVISAIDGSYKNKPVAVTLDKEIEK